MNSFDLETEQIVLGSIIYDSNSLERLEGIELNHNYFSSVKHQYICSAINNLILKGEAIDLISVNAQLKHDSHLIMVGGPSYISEITNRVASSVNIQKHFRILQQLYFEREMIDESNRCINDITLNNVDIFEVIDNRQKALNKIQCILDIEVNTDKAEIYRQFISRNEKLLKSNGITGVPSGLRRVDEITSGWQKSDLIILAARPSMGKTTLAIQFAINAVIYNNIPTAFFSLEMSSSQVMDKAASSLSEQDLELIQRKGLTGDSFSFVDNAYKQLMDAPIHIDDTPALTIKKLRSKALKLKNTANIQLIIVDYLQLMVGDKGSREQEVSSISRGLKRIAKELDVPIIALCQLSRAVEQRGGDKRPMLSDLRDSGAIEQDADIVSFVYRPEYYGIDSLEDGTSTAGLMQLIFAKHRNGALDEASLSWIPSKSKVINYLDRNNYSFKVSNSYSKIEPNTDF